MASTRTPPRRWIDAGLRALAAGGPDALRVEALAQALGVSKGGFYWQFRDRDAFLTTLLEHWERISVDDVIARVDDVGGDACDRLRLLFQLATGGDPVGEGLLSTDLAVRGWASREPWVAVRLREIDNRRMDYMRGLFAEICVDDGDVEARCFVAYALWIGNHFVAAEHGARTRAEVLALVLDRLIA